MISERILSASVAGLVSGSVSSSVSGSVSGSVSASVLVAAENKTEILVWSKISAVNRFYTKKNPKCQKTLKTKKQVLIYFFLETNCFF